jgi:Family of unknown function (DUF6695)
MNNTGIIIILAYPETVVPLADEWYSPILRFIGIGNKHYIRAGHAALLLINKDTGILDYYDFGRYITAQSTGRVRGKDTDHELDFDLKAQIKNGKVINLVEILKFLTTNSEVIHGDGKLVASICNVIDYQKAKDYITMMQKRHFIRYGIFNKEASNCSRFVTSTLIASVTNKRIKKQLIKSTIFTPSPLSNVVLGNTGDCVYEVSETGEISEYSSSVRKENLKYFFDSLKNHEPNLVGNKIPKPVEGIHEKAQWLGGVGSGAWFELHNTSARDEYRFRRISPYGNIDVDGYYKVNDMSFDYEDTYSFVHYSNCSFCHVEQNNRVYRFDLIRKKA